MNAYKYKVEILGRRAIDYKWSSIFKDVEDLTGYKHISVVDEYNAFRNYHVEHKNGKYSG